MVKLSADFATASSIFMCKIINHLNPRAGDMTRHLNPRAGDMTKHLNPWAGDMTKHLNPRAGDMTKHLNPRPLLLKEKGGALSLRRGLG